MKSQIEKIRVEKALQSLTQGVQTLDCEDDSAEENLICTIEKEKVRVCDRISNDLQELSYSHKLRPQRQEVGSYVDGGRWIVCVVVG